MMWNDFSKLSEDKARLVRYATYASVTVASVLIGAKLFAWIATDAVSLQASLIDSLLDVAASLINLLAVRHALRPPDREHRFGHGKAEAIAALGQALFVAISAAWLLWEVFDRFKDPQPIEKMSIGIVIMVFAIILTVLLITFQHYVVRKTRSAAIRADSIHYRSDLLINCGVIATLIISFGVDLPWLDPCAGGLIALYILWTAWTIVSEAFDILMDRELSDAERQDILDIVNKHPDVKGCHDLRTRSSGLRRFIQIHLELDGDMTLNATHKIVEEVEQSILAQFPDAEVLIHQDPEGILETHDPF